MRNVLVTGTNGGIGSAIAKHLVEEGFFVIGSDIGDDIHGLEAYISCDLEKFANEEATRDSISRDLLDLIGDNGLHALVNNAAVLIPAALKDLSMADFAKTMSVNVTATLALIKTLFSSLEKSRGSIVNIGSIHANLTKPGFVAYATSKAALRGLTKSLTVECGARVRVNLIEPAAISTPMLLEGFVNMPDKLDLLHEYHPAGRIGRPEEIASLVSFMISGKCRFMNGAIIPVDGGIASRLHDPV